jgi:predicted double-glycine peptidase
LAVGFAVKTVAPQEEVRVNTGPIRRHVSVRGVAERARVLAVLSVVVGAVSGHSAAQQQPPVRSLLEQRQDGVVIQRWDLSCGAAALATILNFQHGDAVSEREIAIGMMSREEYLANPEIVTFRQGFSLLDLKRFVDARGYNGVGLGQLSIDDLVARAPIIVPISSRGYQHFVVFRGIQDGRVSIADPAFSNRSVSRARFEAEWLAFSELGRVGFYVEGTSELASPTG